MMNAASLAQALGANKSGQGWMARCPAHDDRTPSLSICETNGGKVLVHCHAGCSQVAVIDGIKYKYGFDLQCTSAQIAFDGAARDASPPRVHARGTDLASADEQDRRAEAARRAEAIWAECAPPDPAHSYLLAKKVAAHDTRLYRGPLVIKGLPVDNAVVVPIRNANGQLTSLSFIVAPGTDKKRYLQDGRKKGGFFAIGELGGPRTIVIAEGFATGASILAHQSSPSLVPEKPRYLFARQAEARQFQGDPQGPLIGPAAPRLSMSPVRPSWQ